MNVAEMLSGSWRTKLKSIKCQSNDTARARSARTRNKQDRFLDIPELIEEGYGIIELAKKFDRSISTIIEDLRQMAEEGLIDKSTYQAMTKKQSHLITYENPTKETIQLRNKIYVLLCAKPMTYAEIMELTGVSRTSLLFHMREMEKNLMVNKTGKCPVVFFAVK